MRPMAATLSPSDRRAHEVGILGEVGGALPEGAGAGTGETGGGTSDTEAEGRRNRADTTEPRCSRCTGAPKVAALRPSQLRAC